MKKNYIRLFSVFVGILFVIFLLANFGLNLWLKYRLPEFIKNNSEYKISYQSLDVHLGTGNIFATGITINNKNTDKPNSIGLQGTVDTLSVSQLGIFDAVFNKRINTSDLILRKPNLNIVLAKPLDGKTGKKKNPIVLENITITDGKISVFKYNKQKFLSVNSLNLNIENLQLTEKSMVKKLPVIFDRYEISGTNFYFRPDNLYAVTAQSVNTKEGQMNLKEFAIIPLLSQRNFIRFYPKKAKLFSFKSSAMEFKDIVLKNNRITLSNVRFQSSDLTVFKTNTHAVSKGKEFNDDIRLENILVDHMKVTVLKPDGSPMLKVGNLNMNITKFLMNGETVKNSLPFEYGNFKVSGQHINYITNTENTNISALSAGPQNLNLQSFSVKPTGINPDKTLIDLTGKNIDFKIKEWKFVGNKLKIDIQNVLANTVSGKIVASKNSGKKKPAYKGISFPLTVRNLQVKNSNLVFDKGDNPMVFENLNGSLKNIEMNASTVKEAMPFKVGSYNLITRNFRYGTEFYNLSAALMEFTENKMHFSGFMMKPKVSRAQFIRMIPSEKDLYDIKVNQISVDGSWDFVSPRQFLNASQITMNGVNANIFRSKIPKDDLSEKPLYSKLLRTVKFPLFVENLDIKNSVLEYEEDTKKSDGPGKLTFNNFNLNAKNLNSGKMKGKPTVVPINISCRFMNASPMNVKWSFDVADRNDGFSIAGNIGDLPASRINPFIEPYLKIRATGLISDLIFNFKGNNNGLNGSLNMKHRDLKVSVLKETGEKNKLLSAIVNVFVRTNSGNYPESVAVEDVQRDKTKSFFNLFWRGIEQGLKKTLIGKNALKNEASIKNTVTNTKAALQENKKDLQETNESVKEKVQETKHKLTQKGGLRTIFKKKSEK
ncbi:MAG: hypothetical protein L6264_02790 [Weeksellaceae bacterium]|nr:hypothetical protein [Bacteroidota bacterium]MCG2779847.1 hypothetical protein [Weeksellaceae bacterium]